MSYDGGPFEAADRRLGGREVRGAHHHGKVSSYWTPIPQGTTRVTFRLSEDTGHSSPIHAKDFSVWSLSRGSSSSANTQNNDPNAVNDSASTDAGVPVLVQVLANDSDPDGNVLSVAAVTQSSNGSVTNHGSHVTYSPASGFDGTDSFTYTASDGKGGTAVATVTVTVAAASSGSGGSSGGGASGGASPQAGTRISWDGGEWFLAGANLPWIDFGRDFGSSSSGVRTSGKQANLHARFADLQSRGVHAVRWWLFPGDASEILRDGSGRPTGVDPNVYPDIDAALELAETYDLYYTFVIFSGPDGIPQSWMTNPSHRAALADALAPMFARYNGNPRVMTWEVYNEPEWAMWNGRVDDQAIVETVRGIAAAVHANSDANVTVGSAHINGLSFWVGVGLDYYDAHWYDGMTSTGSCAMCTDYEELKARHGLDAPLVIGEFFGGSGTAGRWQAWYDKGFAGAWAWSMRPAADGMTIDIGAIGAFTSGKPDIGPSSP